MINIAQAIQQDQAQLDQRWAQAREWLWQLGELEALRLQNLLACADVRVLARAMRTDRQLADNVRYLAVLAFDDTQNRCLDEQIAIEADPQAANQEQQSHA